MISRSSQSRRKRRAVGSYSLTGLTPYTLYGVQMLAVTVANGVPSVQFNVTSGEAAPSFYPLNLTAYNSSSTSLTVRWDEVPDEHKNGIITEYTIKYKNNYENDFKEKRANGNERTTELAGLEKYELYDVYIRAATSYGSGNYSQQPVIARTAEDIPDSYPKNISTKSSLTTFTVRWDTMTSREENGIILGYEAVALNMKGDRVSNSKVYGNTTTIISGLDIWTNYTVEVRAFTIVGDGPWSPKRRFTTDEQAPQDVPKDLKAEFSSSTSLQVKWKPIKPSLTKGIPRGYNVYYRPLNTPFNKALRNVTVGVAARSVELNNLYKYVEYKIYIKALTNKEGNASETVKAYTDEDKPDKPPSDLIYQLPSPTTIWLQWYEIQDGYTNGILQGFKLSYKDARKSNPPVVKTYSPDVYSTTLYDLPSFVQFEITICGFTVKGNGPKLKRVIRTDESVPDQTPQNPRAENHSSVNSLPVTWGHIPPGGVPGILLGYRIWYTPVSTGDVEVEEGVTKEIRVDASKTSVLLTNLHIFTRYKIVISGLTSKGDGPVTITFGETCRCKKRFTSSWMVSPPYVNLTSTGDATGIMPSAVKEMVTSCCGNCKEHGSTELDFTTDGYNEQARKAAMSQLSMSIDGMTDIIFPFPGFASQTSYKTVYGFQKLIETPGIAFIISSRSVEGRLSQEIITSIWGSWPLFLISFLLAFITGCFVWMFECSSNQEQFPRSYIKGSMEGFWFAFISMTTVGYGDRCPSSKAARILSLFWTLFGIVLTGMIIGKIAVAMTTVAATQATSLYGMKVGALRDSFEFRFGIRRNAKMNTERQYASYEQIYEDIDKGLIRGALLDPFAIGSRKDLFEKPFIRIKKIYDVSFVYGIISSGNATLINRCFKRYTRSKAAQIANTIKEKVKALEVVDTPLAAEMSSGIFDSTSAVFVNFLTGMSGALIFFTILGLIWHVIYMKRKKAQSPDARRQELVNRYKKVSEVFYRRLSEVAARLKEKHLQEILQLRKLNHEKNKKSKPKQSWLSLSLNSTWVRKETNLTEDRPVYMEWQNDKVINYKTTL